MIVKNLNFIKDSGNLIILYTEILLAGIRVTSFRGIHHVKCLTGVWVKIFFMLV